MKTYYILYTVLKQVDIIIVLIVIKIMHSNFYIIFARLDVMSIIY